MALPTPSLTLPPTWLATPLILSVALPIVVILIETVPFVGAPHKRGIAPAVPLKLQ
jgi:hypothetical protein